MKGDQSRDADDPSEDVDTTLVEAATRGLCDEGVHNIWRTYYESCEVLQKICNVHPDYEMIPLGTGFDALPIPLYTKPSDDGHLVELRRPPQFQQMMCVRRDSIVLPSGRTSGCSAPGSGAPVKNTQHSQVYDLEMTNPGFCRLRLRTESGTSQEINTVRSEGSGDQSGSQSVHQSSEELHSAVRKNCSIFLTINRRTVGTLDNNLQPVNQSEEPIVRNRREEGSLQNIHAMETVGALFCPAWEGAQLNEWMSAHKGCAWPPSDVTQKVPTLGFHVVPFKEEVTQEVLEHKKEMIQEKIVGERIEEEKAQKTFEEEIAQQPFKEQIAPEVDECGDNGGGNGAKHKIIKWKWRLNFRVAEHYLFKHLNTKQRQIVYGAFALLSIFREIHQSQELKKLLRHSQLHFFSANVIDSSSDVVKNIQKLLEFILQCVQDRICADFFIPTLNLLGDIPSDVIKRLGYVIKATLRHLMTSLTESKYLPLTTYRNYKNDSTEKISPEMFTQWLSGYLDNIKQILKLSLLQTFDDVVNLLMMTSFARMTSRDAVEESMALHEEVLKTLNVMKETLTRDHKLVMAQGDVVKRFNMFVQLNLGTLYHCAAVQTQVNTQEQLQFYKRAEEYLQAGCRCDAASGFIRLAHLFYAMGAADKALAFLNKMMHHIDDETVKENAVGVDVFDNSNFGAFRSELWRPWLQGRYAYDVMFCRTLNPICPPQMTQSFTFSQCMMLGITLPSLAIFSARFFASYLTALCRMSLKQPHLADEILTLAEEAAIDEPQPDLNERRTCAYLNIIARCYIQMKNADKARYAIHQSMRIFSSPRNPARFLRYELDYGATWCYVKQGFKVLVLSAVAYVVVQYARVNYRLNNA